MITVNALVEEIDELCALYADMVVGDIRDKTLYEAQYDKLMPMLKEVVRAQTNVKYIKIKRIDATPYNVAQPYYWEAFAGNNKCTCWSGEEFDRPSKAKQAANKTFPGVEIRDETQGGS